MILCIGLFAAESLWRWPNYLAYFNQIAGGPQNGYRHLVDSSLDWGQELPALKRWLDKNGLSGPSAEKTYLSYFGVAIPHHHGIDATLLPCYWPLGQQRIPEPLEPGTYCISATMLQNIYNRFAGRWSKSYEKAWHDQAANVRTFDTRSPVSRQQLVEKMGEAFWIDTFDMYEQARLSRLTSYLRHREPDAQINGSILIYRLDASDLQRALEGPPVELDDTSLIDVQTRSQSVSP